MYTLNDIERTCPYESIEDENKDINKFIQQNEYCSYQEMAEHIKNNAQQVRKLMQWDIHIALYDRKDYQTCKDIYNNITNEEKLREIGNMLNDTVGLNKMKEIYYLLFYTSPLAHSDSLLIRSCHSTVEAAWNGIGEWRR